MKDRRHFTRTCILIFAGLALYVPFVAGLTSFTDATPITTKVSVILLCLCSILLIVVGLEIQREKLVDIWRMNATLKRQLEKEKEKNNGRERQHEIHPL